MKVLTVKQPFATLIAEGYKAYEVRTWKTKYRGELWIHAGKGVDKEAMEKFAHLHLTYPKGTLVARTYLTDCILLDEKKNKEIQSQNTLVYEIEPREGYAFKLENIQKIDCDKQINGKLGIWELREQDFK